MKNKENLYNILEFTLISLLSYDTDLQILQYVISILLGGEDYGQHTN